MIEFLLQLHSNTSAVMLYKRSWQGLTCNKKTTFLFTALNGQKFFSSVTNGRLMNLADPSSSNVVLSGLARDENKQNTKDARWLISSFICLQVEHGLSMAGYHWRQVLNKEKRHKRKP
jgi:hypothetical protein